MSNPAPKKRGRPRKEPETAKWVDQEGNETVVTILPFPQYINKQCVKNGIKDAIEGNSFYEYPYKFDAIDYETGRLAGSYLKSKGITQYKVKRGPGGYLPDNIVNLLYWNQYEYWPPIDLEVIKNAEQSN